MDGRSSEGGGQFEVRVLKSKSLMSRNRWCQEGQTTGPVREVVVAGLCGCAERGSSRGRRLLGGGQPVDRRMTTLAGGAAAAGAGAGDGPPALQGAL